MVKHN